MLMQAQVRLLMVSNAYLLASFGDLPDEPRLPFAELPDLAAG
jgi:hypothetical protein